MVHNPIRGFSMNMMKSLRLAAIAGALLFTSNALALADSTIKATLWDKGTSAEIKTDMGMGMTGDHSKATMGIKLSKDHAKAGNITFKVKNSSKETIHEMVVIPYPADGKVPYSDKDSKFDEDAAGHLGEVSELEPGKSGAVTLDLKPGKYILSCNIATHYANGMWVVFTVE
jgi:uncharacterized cupredoxin-like copper-binding protein